ncbi:MAG: hypothetical protein V4671_10660 [Armatimonadota bacterium]
MKIEITDGDAHLTIEFTGFPYTDADYWNRNWVSALIMARLPGFWVAFRDEIHLSDLEPFHRDLQTLYTELKGTARLHVMNGCLDLSGEIDHLGHLHWNAEIAHPVGAGNEARLTFAMHADQSYLPSLLAQIKTVMEAFPIKG